MPNNRIILDLYQNQIYYESKILRILKGEFYVISYLLEKFDAYKFYSDLKIIHIAIGRHTISDFGSRADYFYNSPLKDLRGFMLSYADYKQYAAPTYPSWYTRMWYEHHSIDSKRLMFYLHHAVIQIANRVFDLDKFKERKYNVHVYPATNLIDRDGSLIVTTINEFFIRRLDLLYKRFESKYRSEFINMYSGSI